MAKAFRYTGEAPSLDNHPSAYYESENWTICIWNGSVFHSKDGLKGEVENRNREGDAFHFELRAGTIKVWRSLQSHYEGLGRTYTEGGDERFPLPRYVCTFIRSLEERYVTTGP